MSDLERTFSLFRQQPPQQAPPQAPLMQIPQFPTTPQPAATQGLDFQKLLSIINAQNQMQPAPMMPQVQPSQPNMAPNLAAIISQLAGQNQPGAANGAAPSSHYEDPERKRMRETGGLDGAEDERFNSAKRNRSNDPTKKHVSVSPAFPPGSVLTMTSPKPDWFRVGIGAKANAAKATSAHFAMIL